MPETGQQMNDSDSGKPRRINYLAALFPVVALIGLLVVNVIIYSDDATYGPNQIALLVSAAIAAGIGYFYRIPFTKMLNGVVNGISSAMGAILILLMIGSLAGTWMLSGVVPAMIYYGLDILSPQIFLVASCIICIIVSVATGSSWSTVATVGIALLGIGDALGISQAMTAGAIISGAYFGDKISPLSDTTNLAAAMAGCELITHIRYMLWTTVPSILIALGVFWYLGTSADPQVTVAQSEALADAIDARFHLSPLLFLVPAAVIAMVIFRVPALVALFFGTLLGGLFALIFQPDLVKEVAGSVDLGKTVADWPEGIRNATQFLAECYTGIVNALFGEIAVGPELTEAEAAAVANDDLSVLNTDQTARVLANDLLGASGMFGMMNTVWLVICAMSFGGVMEACGFLRRLSEPLVNLAKSDGSLVATTAGSCLFVNMTASDQYLAIVVPGRMFRETFEDRELAPENLSRTLEDSGTVTSALVPWNTCGAYHAGVLGVATLSYLPFCVFNYVSPVMTMLFAFVGIRIRRLKKG
ncbi:MAG: Na+/H+ antiporter NhaC family protein [Planctomycetota bacterium]